MGHISYRRHTAVNSFIFHFIAFFSILYEHLELSAQNLIRNFYRIRNIYSRTFFLHFILNYELLYISISGNILFLIKKRKVSTSFQIMYSTKLFTNNQFLFDLCFSNSICCQYCYMNETSSPSSVLSRSNHRVTMQVSPESDPSRNVHCMSKSRLRMYMFLTNKPGKSHPLPGHATADILWHESFALFMDMWPLILLENLGCWLQSRISFT